MLEIKNQEVKVTKTRKLTPKQIARLKLLNENQKQAYMSDLMGLTRGSRSHNYSGEFRQLKQKLNKNSIQNRRPGHMLNILRGQTDMSEHKNHSPIISTSKNRWVGVEIECYIPVIVTNTGESECYDCDGDGWVWARTDSGSEHRVDCDRCDGDGTIEDDEATRVEHDEVRDALSEIGAKNVSVRDDSSLCDSRGGTEVTFLFDANKGYDQLSRILKVLNGMGAEVDVNCGLHVHLNQHNTNADEALELGKKVEKFLPILFSLIPESRRQNRYCQPQASDSERYSAINLTAFRKHNTIEYRMHTGSTNFNKIKNWIELLIKIEDYCKDRKKVGTVKTLKNLFNRIPMKQSTKEYLTARYNKFNRPADNDNETAGLPIAA